MRKRNSTSFLYAQILISVAAILGATQPAFASSVTLQDSKLLVTFDSDSGALTRLEDKSTGWVLERRSELGMSFWLHAPLPNRRYNVVLGQQQRAAEVRKLPENKVLLKWKNLLREHGGVMPTTLTATVTLESGQLTFEASLVNDSSLPVGTID